MILNTDLIKAVQEMLPLLHAGKSVDASRNFPAPTGLGKVWQSHILEHLQSETRYRLASWVCMPLSHQEMLQHSIYQLLF